jgi:hypothetical protein
MTRLAPLADDLWEARDELRLPGGVVFPVRMTVVRTGERLMLWSPIAIDDALAEELAALGEVTDLAAPNCFHHLYLDGAKERYPDARMLGAPGLAEKRSDLSFDGPLADAALGAEMELLPVDGIPKLNEVLLLHRPSGSLVVTDLVFHVLEAKGLMSWLVFRVLAGTLGHCRQSRLVRWATEDRDRYTASVEAVLARDFDRLVVAHGEVIETGGREALAAAALLARPARRLPAPGR